MGIFLIINFSIKLNENVFQTLLSEEAQQVNIQGVSK